MKLNGKKYHHQHEDGKWCGADRRGGPDGGRGQGNGGRSQPFRKVTLLARP